MVGMSCLEFPDYHLSRRIAKHLGISLHNIAFVCSMDDIISTFRTGDKSNMFSDESDFQELTQCKKDIQNTMQQIRDHRREVRLALRMPSLDYTTVLGTEVSVCVW